MKAEEIRHASEKDEGALAALRELLDRHSRGCRPDGDRTLRVGSARARVAYQGDICRRYVEEYTRLYWVGDEVPVSLRIGVSDSFPLGLVRETTLWQEEGRATGPRAYLGRWDFFMELDGATRSARAVVSSEATFVSVDSALRVVVGAFAPPERCTLLHGMASVRNGVGIVGSAAGRGGKSTSARLLRAQGWKTLCDDLPAIDEADGTMMLSGTPFWSYREEDFAMSNFTSERAPLRAVFLLEKGPKVAVTPCPRAQAVAALMRNVLHYAVDEAMGAAKLQFISRLVETVPVLRLSFLRDELPEKAILEQI